MEAFTLLKSWKPSQGETPQPQPTLPSPIDAAAEQDTDTDIETTDEEEEEEEEDEDEPFFDLEFTVPEEDDEATNDDINESDSEFRFTISPSTNDPNLVQLELDSSEPNSKPQLKASLLKSATKLRIFISSLNKSKSSDSTVQNPNQQPKSESQKKKLFTVKFKVDEVPFASLFTRDNKASQKKNMKKNQNKNNTEESKLHSPSSDEKLRFSKEAIEKYLKKVKPLYIKVSRKYAEKLKFSGQLTTPPVKNAAAEKVQTGVDTTENEGKNLKSQKQGTLPLPAGLRVVCKRLGKSRSAAASTPSPEARAVSSRRRDDSIMQQQDGIQSAILHCKTSFNASKEESSQL